jgi:parvulin-like peptidyl-prolyl isomerase
VRARALLLPLALACGNTPTPVQTAALGGTTVAVAGGVAIDVSLVEAVARKDGKAPRAAVDDLVYDAVLAQGAVEKKLDRNASVRVAERAVLARVVTDRLAHDAAAKGAPTDEELAKLSERHWREVDLPEQARVVHAVVMTKDPEKKKRMRAVAEELRRAVVGAKDEQDFIARAKAVDAQGLEIRPEALTPFVADGRIVAGGQLVQPFATAAFALQPGDTSPIVETQFGLHVIRMLERLPPKIVPMEERRTMFQEEVVTIRAHDAYASLLADQRRRTPVTIDPAADAIMASAR